MSDTEPVQILRLVGVYHASGSMWGEVSYWLRSHLGGAHCSLCDITHGSVREKGDWVECRAQMAVPFVTAHLDERDDALFAFTDGRTPCVVAETTAGLALLVDADQLDACHGSPVRLFETIRARAVELGFALG